MSAKTRAEILDSAKKCVCEDRNGQYGEPEYSFRNIAEYWETYIRHNCVSPEGRVCIRSLDVALMMTLFKIARIETADKIINDSFIDAIGYIACGGDIAIRYEHPKIYCFNGQDQADEWLIKNRLSKIKNGTEV